MTQREALFDFLLRLGDDRLVLGHRLSEWCGHAPILEEDIALANIALDEIGQAAAYLDLAGSVEAKGRNGDALAYFREATEFMNVRLVELPNGDFAKTIARQYFFDAYDRLLLELLQRSNEGRIAAIAAKGVKEAIYHRRHSGDWLLRLGSGTDESHRRLQTAVDDLWRYTPELFRQDDAERWLVDKGIIPRLDGIREEWLNEVTEQLRAASIVLPAEATTADGSDRSHTEHLGHLLAELQIVARSFPGASW